MNSLRPTQRAGIALGAILVLYYLYTHWWYLTDTTMLAGLVGLEVLIAALWKYDERFFAILLITFLWAGMHVPLESIGTVGRWALLAAGAAVGFIEWQRAPRAPFRAIHLIAFFCVCAAFTSARATASRGFCVKATASNSARSHSLGGHCVIGCGSNRTRSSRSGTSPRRRAANWSVLCAGSSGAAW